MRTIPLLNSTRVAIVDEADYVSLSQQLWRLINPYQGCFYACLDGSRSTTMHRVLQAGAVIDHKNRDGLDNRRANLRVATTRENAANTKMYKNNTTGYRGVSLDAKQGRWYVQIKVFGKNTHLGSFKSKDAAALAYNIKALEVFGEFATLNNIMAMQR
jgi:hypothetical protein